MLLSIIAESFEGQKFPDPGYHYVFGAFLCFQVGGIKPGCFKIGNTGGMMDNIIASKLYRPGRSEQRNGDKFPTCSFVRKFRDPVHS